MPRGFATGKGTPQSMNNLLRRVMLPAINRCEVCRKSEHEKTDHEYKRDARLPEWHGWHAARRGLGSNLNRLGVDDSVIQRILRHANISTTQTYYIKTAPADAQAAMAKLESNISSLDTNWTPAGEPEKPM
jgi:integrase